MYKLTRLNSKNNEYEVNINEVKLFCKNYYCFANIERKLLRRRKHYELRHVRLKIKIGNNIEVKVRTIKKQNSTCSITNKYNIILVSNTCITIPIAG